MAAQYDRPERLDRLDLARLALTPGEARRLEVEVDPGELELGGQSYLLSPRPAVLRVDVSRTAGGHALRLRLSGQVVGPCTRCLGEAAVAVEVDAREVDQPRTGDEELTSPYVEDEQLDAEGWAHDALVLALPDKLLCRADCAGLCPVCGVSLNDADPDEHRHDPPPDPRWDKLRELKLD